MNSRSYTCIAQRCFSSNFYAILTKNQHLTLPLVFCGLVLYLSIQQNSIATETKKTSANANQQIPTVSEHSDQHRAVIKTVYELECLSKKRTQISVPFDCTVRVNYWNSALWLAFVADDSDVGYVEVPKRIFKTYPNLKPGTVMQIRGEVGREGAEIQDLKILEVLPVKVPPKVDPNEMKLGEHWCGRITLEGVIEEIKFESRVAELSLRNGDTTFIVTHVGDHEFLNTWNNYIGQNVVLSGTVMYKTDEFNRPTILLLLLSDWNQLEEQIDPSEVDNVSAVVSESSIRELNINRQASNEPSRIRGQIAGVIDKNHYLIEDQTDGLIVHTSSTTQDLVGCIVTLIVQPSENGEFVCKYLEGDGWGPLPPATTYLPTDITSAQDGERCALTGKLQGLRSFGNRRFLVLKNGENEFEVQFTASEEEMASLRIGLARSLTAEGILRLEKGQSPGTPFYIQLSSVDDLHVNSRWFRLKSGTAQVLFVLIGSVGFFCLLWLFGMGIRLRNSNFEKDLLRDRLVQSQKMDAVGRLAGGIAHDFNNLLMGISGSLDLLRQNEVMSTEERIQHVDSAQECAERARILIESLLSFSRQNKLEIAPANLNDAANSVVTLARSLLGPSIMLETDLQADLWTVDFDRVRIEQVLLNLCLNSRDALEGVENGRIAICTQNVYTSSNYEVWLSVEDNGKGMTQDLLKKVFDPFFTTKPVGKGNGLGLSMSYGIIEQHGGRIDAESTPGVGTRFELKFKRSMQPRANPKLIERAKVLEAKCSDFAESRKSATEQTLSDLECEIDTVEITQPRVDQPTQQDCLRILIVDDEPAVLAAGASILKCLGHKVETAVDGQQALHILQDDCEFDCVILDWAMPNLSGSETFIRMQNFIPSIPVVLCSGFMDNYIDSNEIIFEPVYLPKPYRISDMRDAIEEAISMKTSRWVKKRI